MVRWGDMGRPRALFLAQNSPREVSSNLVRCVGFLDTAIGEGGVAVAEGKVQLLKDAGKGLLGGLGESLHLYVQVTEDIPCVNLWMLRLEILDWRSTEC